MTQIIFFIRAFFLLTYFLVFIGVLEARPLLENHHGQINGKSRYGRDPIPPPPSPSSSPPNAKLTTTTTTTITSTITEQADEHSFSDDHQLILLPTSSGNIGRGERKLPPPAPRPANHTGQIIITSTNGKEHLAPPAPKPADEQGQIIIMASSNNTHDDHYNGRGRERKLPPPSPQYDPPIHQVTSSHGSHQGLKLEKSLSDT